MQQVKRYPQSRFSQLTEAELEQVLLWRNSVDIRRNMHQDTEISLRQHLAWFHRLQQDDSKRFFVFYQDNRPIGVLNFSMTNASTLEWGCYLGEINVWPGSGLLLEIAALDYAAAQPEIQHLYAEVLSFNQGVLKLHQLFEYDTLPDKTGGYRNNQPYQVRCFQYPLQRWQSERERILAKLPPAIRQAANQIIFSDK